MIENKNKNSKKAFWTVPLLLFAPAVILILISKGGCEHKFEKLDVYGAIPEFSLKSSNNEEITKESLKGKVVLFSVIQESCPDFCSISLWHLNQMIYQHLRKNQKKLSHVKMISILTDGKGNSTSSFGIINKTLSDQVEDYQSHIWKICKGDAKSIYNITHNNETLLKKDSTYFGGEAFQELLLLMDKNGNLRMVLNGKTEGMIRKMKEAIALLENEYDKIDKK